MNKNIVALVLLCLVNCQVLAMRKQGVAVQGKFLCGSTPPASNTTKVRITDLDTGPDPDDTLDEKFIDHSGAFKVNGYTRELTPIDPVLYVWTDCNDGDTEWLDIGTVNLHSVFENEKRECIF